MMRKITARSSSIFNIFFDVVAAAILVGTGLSGAPAATSAGPANADVMTVCEGNSLSTLDSSGAPLPQEQIDVLVRQLKGLCDASVGTSREFGEDTSYRLDAEAKQSDGFYANVAAQINAGPGVMGISAYANSIPLDGKEKELGCIYRQQDFDGPAVPWESCGAASATSQTYLTTRGNELCPVPGTRWEAMASLYADGVLMGQDTAVALAQ
ncbi:hypothetical protein [Rathayibacter rathayi]|uniref:Uncharacterized protein n=1 Tax=Rathayibacter rathayi TaxID=33887 RepID=A0ABD6W7K4_RATRA|nr:hypothetical protein [Rathayibacter rathayi]PPF12703.1 hypothetical protein C5C04_10635 [Rathayibacter rathayi]